MHIFDPPKLLKNIRDSFMQYRCMFQLFRTDRVASWDDIELWFERLADQEMIEIYADIVSLDEEDQDSTLYAAKLLSKTVAHSLYYMHTNQEGTYWRFFATGQLHH